MSDGSSSQVDFTKEVRFAVVMYGGVSLAIYINGVAQELYRLVRATSPHGANGQPVDATELSGTETVYRKLSHLFSDRRLVEKYREYLDKRPKITAETAVGNGPEAETRSPLVDPLVAAMKTAPSTRFMVDILSGTSAGGINAIYLAKAFANDQQISQLKDLWVNEGDLSLLLNDKQSVMGIHLRNQDKPQSLLNSRRMYFKLLKSLEDMAAQTPSKEDFKSPYVDELDLFITATDIEGVPVPLRLSDAVVYERRHRNVFHFKYGKAEVIGGNVDINDFKDEHNPFLAFAARCTSSFPFAFEPMRLCDIDEVIDLFAKYRNAESRDICGSDAKAWQRFFLEELDPATGSPVRPPRFARRSFGDGGYLDNKPFSYATETLMRRQSDVLVDRKLIYIEPSPEHPEDTPSHLEKPNALQNVKAALIDLPTYETIREDLQRVLDRNKLIERVNRIISGIENDVNSYIPEGVKAYLSRKYTQAKEETRSGKPEKEAPTTGPLPAAFAPAQGTGSGISTPPPRGLPPWAEQDLTDMVMLYGRYFLPYRRLRIASVTDELAKLVARLSHFDENSDQFLAVRYLVRAWREEIYVDYKKEGKQTVNAFLWSYDLGYRMRRLSFTQAKVDELSIRMSSETESNQELFDELTRHQTSLDNILDLVREEVKRKQVEDPDERDFDLIFEEKRKEIRDNVPQIRLLEAASELAPLVPKRPDEVVEALRFIKTELNEIFRRLRTRGRLLRKRHEEKTESEKSTYGQTGESDNPLLEHIKDIQISPQDLDYLLGSTSTPAAAGKTRSSSIEEQDEENYITRARALLGIINQEELTKLSGSDQPAVKIRHPEKVWNPFKAAADELRQQLEAAFRDARTQCTALFDPLRDGKAAYDAVSQRGQEMVAANPSLVNWLREPQDDIPGVFSVGQAVRRFVAYYYDNFDDYDQIRFPILFETDVGESDVVEVIRISPEDAVSLIDERAELKNSAQPEQARQKLAGVSLHHFGAFLDRTWRQNDIMWGRLDGAERLISAMLPGESNNSVRQELTKEAQLAILREELKPQSLLGLESVMSEALLRASTGLSINEAIDKTLQPLKESPVKIRLEEIMRSSLKDEELLKFMSKGYKVNRQLDPKLMLNSVSRASQIIGKMFEDMADANGLEGKRLAWIARLGKIFWGLVEVAVTRSIPNLLFRHALNLLYLFEIALIIGGTLLIAPEIQKFGLVAFGITVAIHFLVWILGDIIAATRRWQSLLKYILIAAAVIFMVLGMLLGSAMFGLDASWKIIDEAHRWFVGRPPGGLTRTWSRRLVVSSLFLVFFVWAIRKDLRALWRGRLDKPWSIPFKPIEILPPYDVHKDRVRKLGLSNRYFIPFRLSDTPPKGWTRMFRKSWKKKNRRKGSAFVKESELRLISGLNDVSKLFPALQKAVDTANSDYIKFLKQEETKKRQAEEQAKVRKEKELRLRQNISSALEKLNSPSVDQ